MLQHFTRSLRFYVLCLLLSIGVFQAKAQGPTCISVYPGIDAAGQIQVSIGDLVTNTPQFPLEVTIRDKRLTQLYQATHNSLDEVITLSICSYLENDLIFKLQNAVGSCSDSLHIGLPQLPEWQGRYTTVLCDDSLLLNNEPIGGNFPPIYASCLNIHDLNVAPDWVEKYDCNEYDNDTLKIVYRNLEGFDKFGRRFETFDTIVVLKFPRITPEDFICMENDTLYCGVNPDFGPKITYEHPITMEMITKPLVEVTINDDQSLNFLPTSFSELCGINYTVAAQLIDDTKCENLYKVQVDFAQECYYQEMTLMRSKGFEDLGKNKYRCTFWVLDIDTMPPTILIDTFAHVNYIGSHDCEAKLVLPDIEISDEWTGLRQTKITVPGHFTGKLRPKNGFWVPDGTFYLPMGGGPFDLNNIENLDEIIEDIPDFDMYSEYNNVYKVYIEASDSCNLYQRDSFYTVVRDKTGPTVVSNDDLIVGLVGKVTWVDATAFDEGSYDNCAVWKILGRRKEWATSCGVNLCDGLETNERINPVEARYAHYLEWLKIDDELCSDTLYQEWLADSAYFCAPVDEHGNVSYPGPRPYIGGGWMEQIPFCCEDACQFVDIELLAIDYWCNFGKGWLSVKVEDKQPVSVVQELESNIDLSCNAYNDHYREIMEKAQSLNTADLSDPERIAAFDALNEVFGGYEKVCMDLNGYMTDEEGNIIVPSESNVDIKNEVCETYYTRERRYVKNDHTGEYSWEYVNVPAIRYEDEEFNINTGIVVANCLMTCRQDIWIDLNDCGEGKITRRFFLEKGCKSASGEWEGVPVQIYKEQIIYISKGCELNIAMFELPDPEQTIELCELEKDGLGNYVGALDPSNTGEPEYLQTETCSSVTIGHKDVLYTLIGSQNESQLKLIRTWVFNDWCEGSQPSDQNKKVTYDQVFYINKVEDCSAEDSKYLISGKILTPQAKPLPNVKLIATTKSGNKREVNSANDGSYKIGFNTMEEVTIVPSKTDFLKAGVSTLDLILIKQDILGKKKITDPYQQIAADVNQNGIIDPMDVLQVRELILRANYTLPNSESFRFMDPVTGKSFGQMMLKSDMAPMDFIGIKIGDVNYSGSVSRSSRSKPSMAIQVEDQELRHGQVYHIPITLDQYQQLIGMQMEFGFDKGGLTPLGVLPGLLEISPEHYAILDDQYVTISWFDLDGLALSAEDVLFTLQVKAEKNTDLKEVLHLSNTILNSEAYENPEIVNHLGLKFVDSPTSSSSLVEIRPNPFSELTNIVYTLEEAERVEVKVYDVAGRTILSQDLSGAKGINEFQLWGQDLPQPGIYYYQVKGQYWNQTGRMVFIK